MEINFFHQLKIHPHHFLVTILHTSIIKFSYFIKYSLEIAKFSPIHILLVSTLLVKYLPYYTDNEKHRHDVRPGLTGLAQTEGRNNLDWDERFKKDVLYVNNITFLGDIKIIINTILCVLKRENIVVPSEDHDLDIVRKKKGRKKK